MGTSPGSCSGTVQGVGGKDYEARFGESHALDQTASRECVIGLGPSRWAAFREVALSSSKPSAHSPPQPRSRMGKTQTCSPLSAATAD